MDYRKIIIVGENNIWPELYGRMYFTRYIAEEKLPEYRGSVKRTGCTFLRTRCSGSSKDFREKGYSIEDFRSSQLTEEDLASADLVLTITKGLAEQIKESFDVQATSCMSIGTFIDTTETEERIPEVTEEESETYQTCFDILEPLMEAVADRIIGELLV